MLLYGVLAACLVVIFGQMLALRMKRRESERAQEESRGNRMKYLTERHARQRALTSAVARIYREVLVEIAEPLGERVGPLRYNPAYGRLVFSVPPLEHKEPGAIQVSVLGNEVKVRVIPIVGSVHESVELIPIDYESKRSIDLAIEKSAREQLSVAVDTLYGARSCVA